MNFLNFYGVGKDIWYIACHMTCHVFCKNGVKQNANYE